MKKLIISLTMLLIGGCFGYGIAILMAHYKVAITPFRFFLFFLCMGLCSILAILAHELGHLITGLLSHYEFISFRFFSWVIQRENTKLRIMKNKIPGTLGQCLMAPKSTDASQPFFLYHYGGTLMNLVCALLSLGIFLLPDSPGFLRIFAITFLLWNGDFAICNGIPLTVSGIYNDARNIQILRKDEAGRICLLKTMRMLIYLQKGCLYSQIPNELYELSDQAQLTNAFAYTLKLTNLNRLVEQKAESDIYALLTLLKPYAENLPDYYRLTFRCEELTQELLHKNRKDVVEDIYDSRMKTYLKQTKGKASTQLIYAALAGFYEQDIPKAEKHLERCMALIPTTPFYADQQMLRASVEDIRKKI